MLATTTVLEHLLHSLLHPFAILGVHDLEQLVKLHWLRFSKAEQPPPFLRYPKFVIPDVPNPQTEVRRVGHEVNALFALVQRGLAGLEPEGKLRRAEQIGAQFIGHRRDDAQVWETDEEG